MQTNKPLPHLTIRQGPWAGTMVRFATVEQLRAVHKLARINGWTMEHTLNNVFIGTLPVPRLNAPQPKES